MPPPICSSCKESRAVIVRPKNRARLCRSCFLSTFELEIHHTITKHKLFYPGERIAIGASGGKDSTVLAAVLKTLNERYNYGLDLVLLAIDEGIKGYRDDALRTVQKNAEEYNMELRILGYEELYGGWTMDKVVGQVGRKGNCTYCGVFRRQALDRGAKLVEAKHVVTGHNADDVAETVMMNLLRGDIARLARTASITTSTNTNSSGNLSELTSIRRSKPLKYAYEKEIVLYAHHARLTYFSTECIYSPAAFRGTARTLLKDLERVRPETILDIVRSGEDMARLCPGYQEDCVCDDTENGESVTGCGGAGEEERKDWENLKKMKDEEDEVMVLKKPSNQINGKRRESVMSTSTAGTGHSVGHSALLNIKRPQTMGVCERCGYMSSQSICQACKLLEGLNKSMPKIGISTDTEVMDLAIKARNLSLNNG